MSVCIPTYNYATLVGQAIESVLAQSFTDFELLVVDDASQDDTAAVVRPFLEDRRVRYVQNETNRGLFANFNFCADQSTGEYLKFLCADDYLHPEFLADTVAVAEADPSIGLVTNSAFQVDERSRVWGIDYAPFSQVRVPRHEAIAVTAAWHYPIGRPTNVLIRRSTFESAGGFDIGFAPPGDLHLWLKVLRTSDLGVVREPRCYIRVHTDKTHDFGNDPTETVFRVWEDAASWPGSTIDRELLEFARYREARRCMQYAVWAVMTFRFFEARRIFRYVTRHVTPGRLLPRLLIDAPGLAYDQFSAIVAKRANRTVVRDPRPRVGSSRD